MPRTHLWPSGATAFQLPLSKPLPRRRPRIRVALNPPPSLLSQLRDGSRGVFRGIRRCLGSGDDRLLVVIDQFEEIFVAASSEDAHAFLDALTVAVGDPTSPLRLVVALRADFYHRPLEHPLIARLMKDTVVEVIPLAGDEMERAIVEPARQLGVEFEAGLAARIAAQAVGVRYPLPLLQYTLSELFDQREGGRLCVKAYDRFGAARLITFDRDRTTREPTVEVAHEALLREWPRLTAWFVEDLEVRGRLKLWLRPRRSGIRVAAMLVTSIEADVWIAPSL